MTISGEKQKVKYLSLHRKIKFLFVHVHDIMQCMYVPSMILTQKIMSCPMRVVYYMHI